MPPDLDGEADESVSGSARPAVQSAVILKTKTITVFAAAVSVLGTHLVKMPAASGINFLTSTYPLFDLLYTDFPVLAAQHHGCIVVDTSGILCGPET